MACIYIHFNQNLDKTLTRLTHWATGAPRTNLGITSTLQSICIYKYRKNSKYWDMYVWSNIVDSDQTALKEQSDQDLHCLPFFLHLLEALLHRKIKLFHIKDNYGSWSGCPNI